MMMLKKRSMIIGGVATAAFMYLYNQKNRESAKVALKNTKTKVASMLDTKKHQPTQMTKAGFSDPGDPDDNRMIEEGAMTSVMYYNERVQDSNNKTDFPKSQKQKKAPITEESLEDANDKSPAKQQNTKRKNPGE